MDYLKTAENEIREHWFKNHYIKKIEGSEGFQRIVWGKEDTRMYHVEYVLSGNMVFITGDLGVAAYSLTCKATLENIKDFNLSYFTGKLSAHQRERWDFDASIARQEIKDTFIDWCDVESFDDLEEEDKRLCQQLISATYEWSDYRAYETMGIWNIYNQTESDWFDTEAASYIANCGKQLPRYFIAYWLGLKMIIEQLEKNNQNTKTEEIASYLTN